MEIKNAITTVAVSKETLEVLREICKKDESYDKLIKRLALKYYNEIKKESEIILK